ncbi:MAG TPA: aminoacyl-tRNA hydrolase [Fimbriimonadaceae bacterium]|nr:aminoacyl-tRNA hydrolase [Fimbriimonadaceae bacterium]HRJ95540.1 aminoacyl-tRNA hydrolase [Fimbriimonadaceae bacterium]
MLFRKKKPEPAAPPEAMIVGLGNPGPEYAGTRHNVGFDAVERLAKRHRAKLDVRKHRAVYGIAKIEGRSVLLIRPLTYMNLSGQAVAALARQYGIPPEQILVISDDMDLDLGRVRMKPKGGAGGHNGHRSIIASLGSQDYPRIKIGIGRGGPNATDHVLDKFHPDERQTIDAALDRATRGCEIWLEAGLERATSWVNSGEAHDEGE